MGIERIEVGKLLIKDLAEDYSKIGGIVDFVSQQLLIMHDNDNGEIKHSPAATLFQLHTMLENLDSHLMQQETIVGSFLDVPAAA